MSCSCCTPYHDRIQRVLKKKVKEESIFHDIQKVGNFPIDPTQMEWMDKKKVGVPLLQLSSFIFLCWTIQRRNFHIFPLPLAQNQSRPSKNIFMTTPKANTHTHMEERKRHGFTSPKNLALCMSLFRSSNSSFMGQIETKQYLITVLQRIVRSCQSDRLRFMVLVWWKSKRNGHLGWNEMEWNPISTQMTYTGQQWLTAALIKTNVKWYSTLCNPYERTHISRD